MGGLDSAVFSKQLAEARSFSDKQWCGYWDSLAVDYLATAENIVQDSIKFAKPRQDTCKNGYP
jgi:hypothetical protein